MSAINRSSKCVFVGNIPYDATEQQLIDIFQQVGPVVSFRLVFDRETQKPRGYGFCEFRDSETALSAIRNLNGHELGGRSLRVDFAENEKSSINTPGGMGTQPQVQTRIGIQPTSSPQNYDTLNAGGMNYTGTLQQPVSGNPVMDVVSFMNKEQTYEFVLQMKSLTQQNREQARQLLLQYPQLAYFLLQAQVILGMVKPNIAQQLLVQPQASPNIPTPIQPQIQTAQQIQSQPLQQPLQTQTANKFSPPLDPSLGGPQNMMMSNPLNGGVGIPQPSNINMGMTPMMNTIQQQPMLNMVLQQVYSLTKEQLEQLPPQYRDQVLMIQQQMRAQNR